MKTAIKRILFNCLGVFAIITALLSLMLCVRTVLNYGNRELFHFGKNPTFCCYIAASHDLMDGELDLYDPTYFTTPDPPGWFFRHISAAGETISTPWPATAPDRIVTHRIGTLLLIETEYRSRLPVRGTYIINAPYFPTILLVVSFIGSGLWLRRYMRERRASKPGFCSKCRYDLRAHKVGERCPECGTPIVNKERAISGPES